MPLIGEKTGRASVVSVRLVHQRASGSFFFVINIIAFFDAFDDRGNNLGSGSRPPHEGAKYLPNLWDLDASLLRSPCVLCKLQREVGQFRTLVIFDVCFGRRKHTHHGRQSGDRY
jgi:hypothetical protein